jgi:cbb3-type cytochrome oxidase maturation protein
MNSLLLLVPAALLLGFGGLAAFLWALRSGQFDDLEGAANRILFDDDGCAEREEGSDPRGPRS